MHETGKAAMHFGHHEHQATKDELAMASKAGPDAVKKLHAHDAHCASYGHMVLAQLASTAPLPHAAGSENIVPTSAAVLASVFLIPPERPQWTGRA
jgi:hypothetical protein